MTATLLYRAIRDFVESTDGTLPGRFEITKEGIVLDMRAPVRPHELTALRLRKRLEKVMPEEIVAHAGEPDVEMVPEGIMRRPDLMVIAEADMEGQGSFDPRTLIAAVEIVSRSNPDNDWVTKLRDYPLIGVPVYAIFDPRTGTGAVLTDIHATLLHLFGLDHLKLTHRHQGRDFRLTDVGGKVMQPWLA